MPLSYESSESRQFIVVVLPEPFGPSSPKISPSLISKLKWSSATNSLYLFTRFSIFTTDVFINILPFYEMFKSITFLLSVYFIQTL